MGMGMADLLVKAATLDAERMALENLGVKALGAIGRGIRMAVMRAVLRGREMSEELKGPLAGMEALVLAAMVAAHLQGRLRSARTAAKAWAAAPATLRAFAAFPSTYSPYAGAVKFTADRLKWNEAEVGRLQHIYGERAVEVTRGLGAAVEERSRRAIAAATEAGAHVRQGQAALRAAMDEAGVTNVRPYLLETLVRTQTQLAYGAGRWNANQDPAIQEILWGYEYNTVEDDRVRPNHTALHGTRYAKDSPQLAEVWPPNGYNCRCTMLEIFDVGTPNPPAATVLVEGVEVVPVPDKGWGFNAGLMYQDMTTKSALLPKAGKVKPKLPRKRKRPTAAAKPGLAPDAWAKSLDSTENRIIDWWGGVGHEPIRAFQAGKKIPGAASKKEVMGRVKTLEKALDRAAGYDGTVYRGLHGLNEAAYNAIKGAKTLKMDALTSASKSRKLASTFTRKEDPRAVLFEIKNRTGVDLDPILSHLKEQEVVLRKGSNYAVQSTGMATVEGRKVLRVVLEEIAA